MALDQKTLIPVGVTVTICVAVAVGSWRIATERATILEAQHSQAVEIEWLHKSVGELLKDRGILPPSKGQ